MEAFVILLIIVGTIALIASPFLKGVTEVWEASGADSKLAKLEAAKESYYTAIKDVDFELAEGKLSEKDHQELRGYYKEKAILTLKEIEKVRASQSEKDRAQKKGKKEQK